MITILTINQPLKLINKQIKILLLINKIIYLYKFKLPFSQKITLNNILIPTTNK